jgi:hypothetical protein
MYFSASSNKAMSGWFETADGSVARASSNFRWSMGKPVNEVLLFCRDSGMLVNVGLNAHTCDHAVELQHLKGEKDA